MEKRAGYRGVATIFDGNTSNDEPSNEALSTDRESEEKARPCATIQASSPRQTRMRIGAFGLMNEVARSIGDGGAAGKM
jgi:hypothetical protein